MAGASNKAKIAGKIMGKALILMVHLMYQNNTAANFYQALFESIKKEMKRRGLKV